MSKRNGLVLGAAGLVAALVLSALVATEGPGAATRTKRATTIGASAVIAQPTPPVTASDFPMEPLGTAPTDGNGLIPNPQTPTGAPAAPPSSCTVTFSPAKHDTSATVNSWIAAHENTITSTTVVCLTGTFTDPVHVWSKSSTALLEIAPAPGTTATLDLGTAVAADNNPNMYWPVAAGVSIVDSRSVEVYGLTIENLTYRGTALVPAGIAVEVRSDTTNTNQWKVPHLSACFSNGGACSDIYLLDNTVRHITNTADANFSTKAWCGNSNVDAYGIAVISAGHARALQHVVVEDNTVTDTRTGQSETVTFNGLITDFLAAGNRIYNTDNIGMDEIGWEVGAAQANHGYIYDNTVYNVDIYNNSSYGVWRGGKCVPLKSGENAAGLYEDGAAYIWFNHNTVWNTNQGINLDCETNGKYTDHLLISNNVVVDTPGTSFSDPSSGPDPPGTPGTSTVAGHDPFALYVDAFGSHATISDVYAHDNTLVNQSQYYMAPSYAMPVVALGGIWSNVMIWHNMIEGLGPTDRYNPLFQLETSQSGGTNTINCNDYEKLSTAAGTVDGNFALPHEDFMTLSAWQAGNGHGWDANSEVGGFSAACPTRSRP